ncbi:DUF3800 domain-containing protein [Actinoplanes couchii]|uniref:DUF3800 domain-containing protein n=1 Tax=Actinoplanes couchii TaxID=403638 RepID=A0ABQ3XBN1_9ACTN|nr:DUF3800 domain-containing protein [Actinoplanes couchii]MDR6323317.1 hypothetical protein [Actinoplanes couchii]GID55830.1 hypothetical protein Aco03nite_042340 [Actinoplanes couchii]
MIQTPGLYAYVDETGDRGVSTKSSRFFSMAGVVVAAEKEPDMRSVVADLRTTFQIPTNKPLHWKDNVKVYPKRQLVSQLLGALDDLQVNYVIFEKAAIPTTSVLCVDQAAFYNYVAGMMMERLLLTACYWPGGARAIKATFGHVRGFNHDDTTAYLVRKRNTDPSWIPWRLLHGSVKFEDTSRYDGLQVADQYAGMLHSAICPDQYGNYEEHHLLRNRSCRNATRMWMAITVMG